MGTHRFSKQSDRCSCGGVIVWDETKQRASCEVEQVEIVNTMVATKMLEDFADSLIELDLSESGHAKLGDAIERFRSEMYALIKNDATEEET